MFYIWFKFRCLSTNTVQLISNDFACLLCFSIICCKYHHGVSVYLSGEISYPKSVTFFFSAYLGGGQSTTNALMLFTPKTLFVCSSFCLPTQSDLSSLLCYLNELMSCLGPQSPQTYECVVKVILPTGIIFTFKSFKKIMTLHGLQQEFQS